MRNKKAQIGSSLQNLIVVFIVVGVILGTGLLIMVDIAGRLDNVGFTITGENGAFINSTGYNISITGNPGVNNIAITTAINDTSGVLIPAANYTVSTAGIVTNTSLGTTFANVSFNYTYSGGGAAFIGADASITGLLNLPTLFGLIVLIAVVGIILLLIIVVLPKTDSGV